MCSAAVGEASLPHRDSPAVQDLGCRSRAEGSSVFSEVACQLRAPPGTRPTPRPHSARALSLGLARVPPTCMPPGGRGCPLPNAPDSRTDLDRV